MFSKLPLRYFQIDKTIENNRVTSMSTNSSIDSRFERSSKFSPRGGETITDLEQLAACRNNSAIARAAQRAAQMKSRTVDAAEYSSSAVSSNVDAEEYSSSAASSNNEHSSVLIKGLPYCEAQKQDGALLAITQSTIESNSDSQVTAAAHKQKPVEKNDISHEDAQISAAPIDEPLAQSSVEAKSAQSSAINERKRVVHRPTLAKKIKRSSGNKDKAESSPNDRNSKQHLPNSINVPGICGYVADDIRASDERKEIDAEIAKYRLVKLADSDDASTLDKDNEHLIYIPANMEQFLQIYDISKSSYLERLKHIDRFVRLIEDRFLGRRYAKNPTFLNNTLEVEESYLGNAFHKSQLKQHTILELLQVLDSQDKQDPLSLEHVNETGQVKYVRHTRALLRHILFNNPYIGSIRADNNSVEGQKWSIWYEQFKAFNDGTKITKLDNKVATALKDKFGTFESFEKAVNLMRSWLIDHDTKRQWTTMFLFPFGPNALYKEINSNYITKHNLFSGQGDLIFSMLQRAKHSKFLTKTQAEQKDEDGLIESLNLTYQATISSSAMHALDTPSPAATATAITKATATCSTTCAGAENDSNGDRQSDKAHQGNVGKMLMERFLNDEDPIDKFAGYINQTELEFKSDEDEKSRDPSDPNSAYLPYLGLPVYEKLEEDFNNLLQCQLNKQHLFIALARMASLNLLVYLLEQEQKTCIANEIHKRYYPRDPGGCINVNKLHDGICRCLNDEKYASELTDNIKALQKQFDITIPVCAKGTQNTKDLLRHSKERQQFHHALFDLSRDSYVQHRAELFLALTVPFLRNSSELNKNELDTVRHILEAAFNYKVDTKNKDKDKNSSKKSFSLKVHDCSSMIAQMVNITLDRDTHMVGLNQVLATESGLCKKVKTARTYYEMSDELLRTLVMAVLGKSECMKLTKFLEIIRERYHLVIGPDESDRKSTRKALEISTNTPDLSGNLTQLKLQLHRLDMLIYLSDYCEYVKRP